jgi:intron-binding protein aquarius
MPITVLTLTLTDIILSLTRTLRPGYIRDLRRLTVALSRARLGLYILGRRTVFESCYEIQDAFNLLFERPTTLQVVTSEMYPTPRLIDGTEGAEDKAESTEIVNTEHLMQYVFEMTKAKVKALREGEGVIPAVQEEEVVARNEEDAERDGEVYDENVGEAEEDGEEAANV